MISIIALSVLLVAQTAAKIGFGPCPTLSFLNFNGYKTAYPLTGPTAVYNHKVMWGDSNVNDLLGFAATFL